MSALDPKFAKVVALMRSSTHAGEQEAARGRAEAMASAAGMTIDEALVFTAPAPSRGFFAGFDDHMEERQPGWKAAQSAERLAKHRAWRARQEALVAKYGSLAAAIEPCERERLILAAVAPWRTVQHNPRWTDTLDGWSGDSFSARKEAPAHVVEAIEGAYPLPATFADAATEHSYWIARNQQLEDALYENGVSPGDEELDLPVAIRAAIVQALAEHEIPVTTLQELHARFVMLREDPTQNDAIEAALFRDVETMARREREAAASPAAPASPPVHATNGQIEALLRAHPDWPDRRIARDAGCSPTTVGKVRRAIGATAATRSVQRRGQTYSVKMETER